MYVSGAADPAMHREFISKKWWGGGGKTDKLFSFERQLWGVEGLIQIMMPPVPDFPPLVAR